MSLNKKNGGYILVQVLAYATIGLLLVGGLTSWAGYNLKIARNVTLREKAFQVAEAGVEYYRWHLAHSAQDFYDGQVSTTTGPYIHDYFDKDGNKVGRYELTITPPLIGSTVVKIVSRGFIIDDPAVSRSIEVRLAIPSLAKYAIVANDTMRFGGGTEVFGPLHSNGGIRFDGLAHNVVTSALDKYDDPDHTDTNKEFGVHTHVNLSGSISESAQTEEMPDHTMADRPDVFMSGRQFPVPVVDFNVLTVNLSEIKTKAVASGLYFSKSNASGYHIVLKTDDTFDLYKVNTLANTPNGCSKTNNTSGQEGWGTWAIKSGGESKIGNYSFPANGLVFIEDNVWVDGQISTARLTIASGRFPATVGKYTSITVNNDLLYTNYDGRDVVALIAQGNINAGLMSADDLEIDGALIAQNGRVGRYSYTGNCDNFADQNKIKLYGMMATNLRYGFTYNSGPNFSNGYRVREINYDGNLLYGPPPSFPLTSDQYSVISWREI